jgi:uncharacterized protein (DUF1778 family)
VVDAAQKAAHQTIEETQIIRVSVEDQAAFAESVLNPPPLAPPWSVRSSATAAKSPHPGDRDVHR